MHLFKKLTMLLCGALISTTSIAQTEDSDTASDNDKTSITLGMGGGSHATHRWYMGNSFDGAIFGTAVFERPGQRRELTTLRFSAINIGYHFNYDFDDHFGIFTGLGIKNIGFIEKVDDSTIKRRVYTIGVPLGWKIGNLQKRHFLFFGGGVDIPFNYREKGFVKRNDKEKFNEWFSKRTPTFMPYLFAGFSYGKGSTFKVQYYPGNFFNQEFEETNNGITTRPYTGYSAHLLNITLGLDLQYKKHESKKDNGEDEEEAPAPAEM